MLEYRTKSDKFPFWTLTKSRKGPDTVRGKQFTFVVSLADREASDCVRPLSCRDYLNRMRLFNLLSIKGKIKWKLKKIFWLEAALDQWPHPHLLGMLAYRVCYISHSADLKKLNFGGVSNSDELTSNRNTIFTWLQWGDVQKLLWPKSVLFWLPTYLLLTCVDILTSTYLMSTLTFKIQPTHPHQNEQNMQ